jgi:hypothetical protein
MLPGEGVVVVAVEVVFAVELPPSEAVVVRGLLGTTTVTVTRGVVLVSFVVPGLDLLGAVEPGCFAEPGWKAAYSTVETGAE